MFKFLLSLSYDGTDYCGWVIQKNRKTVQGILNAAIKKVIRNPNFKTLGGSKTDAGVHALDQKVVLICDFKPLNLCKFRTAINKVLPQAVKINSICEVGLNFNLPQAIAYKVYEYVINNGEWDFRHYRYELLWQKTALQQAQLQAAANLFVGQHDFKNFSGLNTREVQQIRTVREVKAITVQVINQKIHITLVGASFIRYQIRMIIAALLKMAEGQKYTPQSVLSYLDNPNFNKFPHVAPTQGLTLKSVVFKDSLM